MKELNLTEGKRVYHSAFGWATVNRYSKGSDKILLDLDAIEVKYYSMGHGYKTMKGKGGKGIKTLFCDVSELANNPAETTKQQDLFAMCLNAKIVYPANYVPDHEK